MDFVGQLWLPILAATAICFVASAVVWMAGPHHKKEWPPAPGQDALIKVLRDTGVQAGSYMFPHADRANKVEFEAAMKRWAEGPAGVLFIFPRGPMGMGKMLGQQLVYFLIVNVMLAYVGHHARLDGQPYLRVFQVIGAVGFMAHWLGSMPESIWFGRPWKNLWLQGVDGLLYALLSAGTFAAMWPR